VNPMFVGRDGAAAADALVVLHAEATESSRT
jgi:hypothetical protein